MQIFPQIHHLVLEFDHPFIVEALIFKPHLFLHQEDSIDGLVLLIVGLQLFGEHVCLLDEGIDGL